MRPLGPPLAAEAFVALALAGAVAALATDAQAACWGPLAMTDGDSGRVIGCGAFRLPDFDAPETSMRHADCPAEVRMGRAIRAEARETLDGAMASIGPARSYSYGRAVADVTLEGKTSVRALALAAGWGVEYSHGVEPPPDWCMEFVGPAEMAPDDPFRTEDVE